MIQVLILILAAVGHLILWVALVNRAHALGIRRRWVSLLTLLCILMGAAMPVAVLATFVVVRAPESVPGGVIYAAVWAYIVCCAVVCVVAFVQRLQWRFHIERRGVLTSNHTTRINLARQSGGPHVSPGVATWLCRIPGNQILDIRVHEKQLSIPRLLPDSAGLRIVHLSDLHMSGRMARSFYEYVVDEANCCRADIVAVTGDIVDSNECLDWIPQVLGRLEAPGGVFYVLGNHDARVCQESLQTALAHTDWTHAGGRLIQRTVRGLEITIGGSERPWFGLPSDFASAPKCGADGRVLRIALSHSPDQIAWARANDVDLMLAGHVHGGQVCLPVLGPFTAPSRYGVRYAAGTFRIGDTVLHVSRGTASLTPLRWNCPPEIAVLNLRAASSEDTSV